MTTQAEPLPWTPPSDPAFYGMCLLWLLIAASMFIPLLSA